ncbi:MAG: nucleotidyltransferase domain-containing protein [Patescibacteria group bacterium]
MKRARIIAFLLSIVPFTRMVALDGSLARGEATEKSDIDFFIVLKTGRIWTGRILVTALVHLTGLRRAGQKIAGRICLNRYQTEDFLLIRPKNKKNALDYRHFRVFWGSAKLRARFFDLNSWIPKKGYTFTNKNRKLTFWEKVLLIISWPFQRFFEIIYDVLFGEPGEKYLRNFQIKRILKDPRTQQSSNEQILISDYELRFHPPKVSRD